MLGNSLRRALLVAVLLALAAPAAAQGTVGVILMHGKQSSPNTAGWPIRSKNSPPSLATMSMHASPTRTIGWRP